MPVTADEVNEGTLPLTPLHATHRAIRDPRDDGVKHPTALGRDFGLTETYRVSLGRGLPGQRTDPI